MPLFKPIAKHRIVEQIQSIRQYPDVAYSIAIALVALATLTRWVMGDYVGAQIPFVTFFPAIIIAALLGGLLPGVCAIVLSVVAAWYLFLPPAYSFELGPRELVQLLAFVFFCGINLAIVTVANALMDRALAQEENTRMLVDCVPAGIVVVDEQGTIKLVNASTEKLFGYRRRDLLEKNVEILVPARLADTHKLERKTFLQKPETRPMGAGRELAGRRKDGSEFPVEIGLNPVPYDGRRAVLATVIDISTRKHTPQTQHAHPDTGRTSTSLGQG